MEIEDLRETLTEAVSGYELLDHPFYRRWVEGSVTREELRSYAGQYRHFEALLPFVLEEASSKCKNESARALLIRNLADERGDGQLRSHLEVFDDFAASLGAGPDEASTPATSALVDLYLSAAENPVYALAALLAYEMQLPAVAISKSEGLRSHYGLSEEAVRFWEIHAEIDELHTSWGLEALAELEAGHEEVCEGARRAALVWWAFLDEREDERQAA